MVGASWFAYPCVCVVVVCGCRWRPAGSRSWGGVRSYRGGIEWVLVVWVCPPDIGAHRTSVGCGRRGRRFPSWSRGRSRRCTVAEFCCFEVVVVAPGFECVWADSCRLVPL